MKKINFYLMAFSLIALSLNSCDKNDDNGMMTPTSNIVETAQATTSLSSLVAALTKADESSSSDLIGTLSGTGPFTVLAPTNDAFTSLLAGLDKYNSLEDFSTEEDKALLAAILQYHVISGVAAKAANLSNGQEVTTVQGEKLTVNVGTNVSFTDATGMNGTVTTADVEATNGVVHIINKVLVPQAVLDIINLGTLVDVVVEAEALSVLEAAVIKADLVETLNSDGPFTVFAPTDDAFVALLDALGDDYNSLDDFDTADEISLLKNILLYHVIPAKVAASDLSAGNVGTALTDNNIEVISSGSTFVIGDASDTDANITGTDIMASNGIAHTIDKVLLPQEAIDFVNSLTPNIVELAMDTADLSTLVAALVQADAGLVDLLQTDGPFTVFAPTNQAFADLLDALGDDYNSLDDFDTTDEKELLAKILKYHVVTAQALSTDLSDGQMITTAQGEDVTVSLTGGVFIQDATDTDAQVTAADILAKNGVVHLVNKVLLPQEVVDAITPNIVELAMDTADLSSLVAALVQADAGLVDLLKTDGPFTVFAPTNQAFADLLDALGDDYNSLDDFDTTEEKALLADILKYHVVAAQALSTDLSDGQMITTAQGEDVTVSLTGGVFIQDSSDVDAQVAAADVMASNGVVHVIDKVLLPEDVVNSLRPNIVELAMATADLSSLVAALVQADAGLVDLLQTDGPFTVFAPTNQAFADLLDALGSDYNSLADFDTPEEKTLLADILKYHVVAAKALSTDLTDGQMITTAQGEDITVVLSGGVFIRDARHNDAEVTAADIMASNGVVHIINKVLLPAED